ncbi:hypothetical protein GOP47_0015048, partial [Adiantum capillus-veneris]
GGYSGGSRRQPKGGASSRGGEGKGLQLKGLVEGSAIGGGTPFGRQERVASCSKGCPPESSKKGDRAGDGVIYCGHDHARRRRKAARGCFLEGGKELQVRVAQLRGGGLAFERVPGQGRVLQRSQPSWTPGGGLAESREGKVAPVVWEAWHARKEEVLKSGAEGQERGGAEVRG